METIGTTLTDAFDCHRGRKPRWVLGRCSAGKLACFIRWTRPQRLIGQ